MQVLAGPVGYIDGRFSQAIGLCSPAAPAVEQRSTRSASKASPRRKCATGSGSLPCGSSRNERSIDGTKCSVVIPCGADPVQRGNACLCGRPVRRRRGTRRSAAARKFERIRRNERCFLRYAVAVVQTVPPCIPQQPVADPAVFVDDAFGRPVEPDIEMTLSRVVVALAVTAMAQRRSAASASQCRGY